MRVRCLLVLVASLAAAPALAGQKSTTAEQFQAAMGMARVKRDAGDLASARRYFEDARRIHTFDAAELAEYFWVLAGQDSTAALAVGREALAANPGNHAVRDRSITEAIALKNEQTVAGLAEEGRRREPGTALWPRRLAESFLRQNQPGPAADAYAQALKQPDAGQQDRVGLAVSLEAAKRYVEAAEAWTSVPAAAREGRADLEHSRLRALALANSPAAGEALDMWLAANTGDLEVRELAIEWCVRAGQTARALTLIEPLTTGPKADDWNRRKANMARAAGMPDVAIEAYDRIAGRKLTAQDRSALTELLLQQGQHDRAASLLYLPAAGSVRCDVHTLELIDRISGPVSTQLLLAALAPAQCNGQAKWLRRGIERTVAESNHAAALALIARLPATVAGSVEMRTLKGQLQLWSGNAAQASQTLEAVLVVAPDNTAARVSLVDAYRSQQKPVEAWRIASPLMGVSTLDDAQRLTLAELALEVDRPADAVRLLESARGGTQLMGRAMLATGRPEQAKSLLATTPAQQLSPAAALAWIDAVATTDGPGAAMTVARNFSSSGPAWRDVLSRRIVLEATAGRPETAAALRESLAKIDAQAAVIADVEVALSAGRPLEALSIIATLPNDPQPDRIADLEAIARAGAGDIAGALRITERLRQRRPDSVALQVREAELRYRQSPSQVTLSRLIELHQMNPSNQSATLAAAGALASAGRRTEALKLLSPSSEWERLPIEGRMIAARCLQSEGRPREALALVPDLDRFAGLRAELIGAMADQASTAADRVSLLSQGATRFPNDAALRTRLAKAAWAAGQHKEARDAAASAVAMDPYSIEAWFVLIDAAAEAGSASMDEVLRQFETAVRNQPSLVISTAERLSAFVRSHDDPLVARAIAWLDATRPIDASMSVARDMARARVFSAAERWTESIAAVDSALAADRRSSAALKLRAELLSWSGRHAEAVAAYDTYLKVQPDDVSARRQQARVAGWGGYFRQARQLYEALVVRYPNDERIAAEAAAKIAYFDGRWQAAAAAYGQWVHLEPDNGEARFEQAESLRAAGKTAAADAALTSLDTTTHHRLARAALDHARVSRSPAVGVIADQRDANGYQGQRLLSVKQYGGAFTETIGAAGRMAFAIQGTRVEASGGNRLLRGYRTGGNVTWTVTPAFSLAGAAAGWDLSTTGRMTLDGSMAARWRPADRWSIGAGFDRSAISENIDTVDDRLVASGPFASLAFDSPRTTFDLRATRQTLSDDNVRQMATLSATRSLGERFKQIRIVAWAQSLAFRSVSTTYFSPSSQVRADLGLQYAHMFSTPRFRSDRQQMFAASYLIGSDDRGTTYHHPMLSLAVEFANGLTVDARASWIRSDVYRETTVFFGLAFRPGARGQ